MKNSQVFCYHYFFGLSLDFFHFDTFFFFLEKAKDYSMLASSVYWGQRREEWWGDMQMPFRRSAEDRGTFPFFGAKDVFGKCDRNSRWFRECECLCISEDSHARGREEKCFIACRKELWKKNWNVNRKKETLYEHYEKVFKTFAQRLDFCLLKFANISPARIF